MKENIDEELIRRIEEVIQKRDSVISSTKKMYVLNENIEIIHKEFDTDHDPDSLGNYPVKSETNIKIDANGKAEVNNELKSGSEENIKKKDDIQKNKKQEVIIEDDKKESSASKWLFSFILLVVAVLGFVFMKQLGFFSK